MSDISPVEAAFVWHIRGITAALSEELQRPVEQIQAESLEMVPAIARHIGTLGEKLGYINSKDNETINPSSGFMMLVALTLGMGTYRVILSKQAANSADPESDRAEVTNLLIDLGLERDPGDKE